MEGSILEVGSMAELGSALGKLLGADDVDTYVITTIDVADEHMVQILELMDADDKAESRVSKYNLWFKLHELHPDTADGRWRLTGNGATDLRIEKYEAVTPEFEPESDPSGD